MMRPPLDPSRFDFDPRHLWMAHCAEGPVPLESLSQVREFLNREARPWELDFEEDFLGIPASLRGEAARLLGAQVTDISLTGSTSSGLEMVAQGFPWISAQEVVAPLGEFPANAWPWKALAQRAVRFREVPLWDGHQAGRLAWESTPPDIESDPEGRILESLTARTRLLTLSWVRFQDGLKLDLTRLGAGCRNRGVSLVVDGIQGAGTHAPDLAEASAFACSGHKGLLAPQGVGFLWTAPAFRHQLTPSGTWLSVEEATNWDRPSTDLARDFVPDGRRLEPGGPALMSYLAFRESLRFINDIGLHAIRAHVIRLQEQFLEGLLGLPAWKQEAERLGALLKLGRLGPILSLHHQGRGPQTMAHLLQKGLEQGIHASLREGYLRIAFHGYHREEDLDRLLRWLS